jgi:hypothetical protein
MYEFFLIVRYIGVAEGGAESAMLRLAAWEGRSVSTAINAECGW